MADLAERFRTRLFPALLTAFGVTLLAVGLLSTRHPVDGRPARSRRPDASVIAVAEPRHRCSPCRRSAPPRRPADADPTFPADRVATRVRIAALEIDLPIVKPPRPTATRCATSRCTSSSLGQPGEGKATYLYAHARDGMFLPLLDASQDQERQEDAGHGRGGLDERRPALPVRDHRGPAPPADLDDAIAAKTEELWLQTSEGPKGTPGKPRSSPSRCPQEDADPADAHPTAEAVVCG